MNPRSRLPFERKEVQRRIRGENPFNTPCAQEGKRRRFAGFSNANGVQLNAFIIGAFRVSAMSSFQQANR